MDTFKSLDNVLLKWVLQENGVAKETGTITAIEINPQQGENFCSYLKQNSNRIKIPVKHLLSIKSEELFLPKGYEIW